MWFGVALGVITVLLFGGLLYTLDYDFRNDVKRPFRFLILWMWYQNRDVFTMFTGYGPRWGELWEMAAWPLSWHRLSRIHPALSTTYDDWTGFKHW